MISIYISPRCSLRTIFSKSFGLTDSLIISLCIHSIKGKFLFIILFVDTTNIHKEETYGRKNYYKNIKRASFLIKIAPKILHHKNSFFITKKYKNYLVKKAASLNFTIILSCILLF